MIGEYRVPRCIRQSEFAWNKKGKEIIMNGFLTEERQKRQHFPDGKFDQIVNDYSAQR